LGGRGTSSKNRKGNKVKPKNASTDQVGKGQIWLERLKEAVEAEGKQFELTSKGYKFIQNDQEQEINYFGNFTLALIPYHLNQELALEILKSPGLQRMVVETEDKPFNILGKYWKRWQTGQGKGKFANVPNFTRYVGDNGYRVSVDELTLLTGAIPGYANLSEPEKAKAIFNSTEPNLFENLPNVIKTALTSLFSQLNLVAKSLYIEEAREPLKARANQLIGNQIKDLAEFENVIRFIEQGSTKGTIGETFVRRFVAGEQTGLAQNRKPYFAKELYGGEKSVQPDMLRPQSRRTLDVKVGYSTGDIDDDQLARYVKLIKASRQPENVELGGSLLALGLTKASLNGHDYLFLPDGKGKAEEAAMQAFGLITRKDALAFMAVYYLDSFINTTGNNETGVFRLEVDEMGELTSRSVGKQLPD
jgi:hypothetical protein